MGFLIFCREGVMYLNDRIYYIHGETPAMRVAGEALALQGHCVAKSPSRAVTHLVLGVPCRMDQEELAALLSKLSAEVRVFGGFLDRKELEGYRCYDLLKNEDYLAQNAAITAHCALWIAMNQLPMTLQHCPVLILGWGRIGKHLAGLLKGLGADVTVAVRKDDQRAMLRAFGYEGETLPVPEYILPRFRVVFNTVPAPVLSAEALAHCRTDCIKIELASSPGMEGEDIIDGRGLPGKLAPENSGKLIARTILRLSAGKEDAS